jgi:hypothetical protein
MFKHKSSRTTADFSIQALNTKRAWNDLFQILKENICQPRLVYPVKLSFIIAGEIKVFHKKQKLKEFMTIKSALQILLKELLHTEEEASHRQESTGNNKSTRQVH